MITEQQIDEAWVEAFMTTLGGKILTCIGCTVFTALGIAGPLFICFTRMPL